MSFIDTTGETTQDSVWCSLARWMTASTWMKPRLNMFTCVMNVEWLWIGNDLLKGAWVNMWLQVWGCWKILNFGFAAGKLVENLLSILQIIFGDIKKKLNQSNMYHAHHDCLNRKYERQTFSFTFLSLNPKFESHFVWIYVAALLNQKEMKLLCRCNWWSRN